MRAGFPDLKKLKILEKKKLKISEQHFKGAFEAFSSVEIEFIGDFYSWI